MRGKAPTTAVRQIAYFQPVDQKGKWHAAWIITDTPICGETATLDMNTAIRTSVDGQIHPIVCKRCLQQTQRLGLSCLGIRR